MAVPSRLPWTIGLAGAGWLALAGRATPEEIVCAVVAGVLCGLAARSSLPERRPEDRLPLRAAAAFVVRLPARILVDLWLLLRAAPHPPVGAVRTRRLSHSGRPWRAFAAVAVSLAPNSVAVGLEGRELEIHELTADPPGPELPL